VPLSELLPALIFHVMQGPGTLAEHAARLFDDALVDSSWVTDRRALAVEISRTPLADVAAARDAPAARSAFWRRLAPVALDGTQFSLTNTPQIAAVTTTNAPDAARRAAFAKLTTAVLLEVAA
jgi:hypothetical protein